MSSSASSATIQSAMWASNPARLFSDVGHFNAVEAMLGTTGDRQHQNDKFIAAIAHQQRDYDGAILTALCLAARCFPAPQMRIPPDIAQGGR